MPQNDTHEICPDLSESGAIWTNLDKSEHLQREFPVSRAASAQFARNSPAIRRRVANVNRRSFHPMLRCDRDNIGVSEMAERMMQSWCIRFDVSRVRHC